MPVRFNGPSGVQDLIPAPLVSISKSYVRDSIGRKIKPVYNFNLTGTIVNVDTSKDSPGASGLTKMIGTLGGEAYIRNLFSVDGGELQIISPEGETNKISAYCTVESLNFNQGVWVDRCDYTVTLASNGINGEIDGDYPNLQSMSEDWSITENEDSTFTINHQLSAVAALGLTGSGYVDTINYAKEWCRERSYSISSSGTLNLASGNRFDFYTIINPIPESGSYNNFWNMAKVETVGVKSNSWQLAETFIYSPSGNARDIFSINVNQDDIRRAVVTVNGSVIGNASKYSDFNTRFNNAKNKFATIVEPNLYLRASAYLPNGFTANTIPTTKQLTYDINAGAVQYSASYSAYSGYLIPNAIDESLVVNDVGRTDVIAQIPVPGRANGPVVQFMNSSTLPERTVSLNATLMQNASGLSVASLRSLYLNKPNTDSIFDALKPEIGYYYIKQNSEEWNPIKRIYSRTVSWTLQPEGQSVSGIPTGSGNPDW